MRKGRVGEWREMRGGMGGERKERKRGVGGVRGRRKKGVWGLESRKDHYPRYVYMCVGFVCSFQEKMREVCRCSTGHFDF